jgi:hypothetical protein
MTNANFPKGLFFNLPHNNAPDFVKGAVNIKRDSFIEWLKTQDETVNIDLKISREGKAYAQVNEWKPEKQAPKIDDSFDDSGGLPF